MKNIFYRLLNAGVNFTKDPQEAKTIMLMNRMGFIMTIMMFVFSLLSPIMGLYNMLYFTFPFAFAFILVPYFNYKHWLAFNRYYFSVVPFLFLCLLCWYNSIELGDRFFFFATATIPVIVFREKLTIFLIFSLNIFGFFCMTWYQNTHAPVVYVPASIAVQYWCSSLLGVFLVLFFVVRYFKKGSEDYEKQIETKNEEISTKNKEIVDSINYAKKIQNTLLAHNDFLQKHLPDHFVFFKPKDIVSGDFYWATEHNNKFYLAVCDSTGHGVPGAFMCLLNIGFLNEGIKEKNIAKPNEIFDHVRTRLINDISKEGQQDGMDGILMTLENKNETLKIEYAGANNAPVLIRNNQIIILPTDKMPVGKGEKHDLFKLYNIEVHKGDTLYLYTDGFADQFGGPKGKKFKYKALNELLLLNHQRSTSEQKDIFNLAFENWRGNLEQVDDVCVIGIKL
ncbi:MAG: SpoIIE family protein phosphatase [Bacteroidota bacterium]|nr:SpoIIE family protein phosphatase [Bacteroidota bacterium]